MGWPEVRVNRYDIAAWVAGAIGIIAAISTAWIGQHMLIWAGFAAVVLVICTALAEKEGHR